MEFNCGREVEEKVGGKLVLLRTVTFGEVSSKNSGLQSRLVIDKTIRLDTIIVIVYR
jgi:hypothetical protein